MYCKNCGAEINDNAIVCVNCGTEVKHNAKNEVSNKVKGMCSNKKSKKIILLVILFLGMCGMFFGKILPTLTVTTEDLLVEGNYEEAYKKADASEKEKVEFENLIAYISNQASDSMKNPSSFQLREAWYDKSNNRIVLCVNGTNSFGGIVSSYWYYNLNTEKNEYELFATLSSLETEKANSWDDDSEFLEKFAKNAAKIIVSEIIENDKLKLDDTSVDNINNLFKNGQLKKVQLLNVNSESGNIV